MIVTNLFCVKFVSTVLTKESLNGCLIYLHRTTLDYSSNIFFYDTTLDVKYIKLE